MSHIRGKAVAEDCNEPKKDAILPILDLKFFAEKMDKKSMSDYGLDPMEMVETVVKFVIRHKGNAKPVDDCFEPNLSSQSQGRLNAPTAEELMKIYWGTDKLEDCQAFRYFVVKQYLEGKMKNVKDLNVDKNKFEKVSDVPKGDVDTIVMDYRTSSGRIHYERVFTDESMKENTAVLVQKVWDELVKADSTVDVRCPALTAQTVRDYFAKLGPHRDCIWDQDLQLPVQLRNAMDPKNTNTV